MSVGCNLGEHNYIQEQPASVLYQPLLIHDLQHDIHIGPRKILVLPPESNVRQLGSSSKQ